MGEGKSCEEMKHRFDYNLVLYINSGNNYSIDMNI